MLVGGVVCYNIVFCASFAALEDGIMREGLADLVKTHQPGTKDLVLAPYYPNPDLERPYTLAPQFALSRPMVESLDPDRILLHHGFYNAFLDNPRLLKHPKVADMTLYYLEMRAGKAGYRDRPGHARTAVRQRHLRPRPVLRPPVAGGGGRTCS